jgi:predicted nucleic acid-binding protein
MASQPISFAAVVLDANVVIAIAAKETGRDVVATSEIARYAALGYDLYAPGALVTETLYALCNKVNEGTLSLADHAAAVGNFVRTMRTVKPPPSGDASLIQRAEQIRAGYGCSRSADGVYIALAEELALTIPTVLLTFDQGVPRQAASNATTVAVKLL